MSVEDKLTSPSLQWRAGSTATLWFTGSVVKLFYALGARVNAHGLDRFLRILDERADIEGRQRGLLTVSNHVSVVDDPLVWGFLPYRHLRPDNIRWSLASHDICFKNGSYSALSNYFSLGQTLPTHRAAYSPHGGLFQPTISQCIRLLSKGPFTVPTALHPNWQQQDITPGSPSDVDDPFTNPTFHYTTTINDLYRAPSAYATRRHSWVHVFPEGKVHQHPEHTMRYFKWGVARLILESEQCPMVVPMWIEGPEQVMHEARTFPRFLPRLGKKIDIVFGEPVAETVWDGFRERWRQLKARELKIEGMKDEFEFLNDELRDGREARELRIEVASAVREEVLKLRRERGWPDEDPKARLVDTWIEEGGKREGKMDDESWVKDT